MNWRYLMAVVATVALAESPPVWLTFQSSNAAAHVTGVDVVTLTGAGPAKSYVGMYRPVAVMAGQNYRFSLERKVTAAGAGRAQISLEWKDAAGAEVGRVWGPDWSLAAADSEWRAATVTGNAPTNAVTAHLVVTLFLGEPEEPTGTVAVQHATFTTP